ncbi:hypothetical protein EB796_012724 [Bugula neritina]|uniref:N-acetyltransferase domain-containing protein n=1 Tax=Bugula neritina TaxID=10212 RepID=A0A7J7JSU7_BUGNE|nr:hypothetical protein EB796_012724 [Bugula neritina]
MNQVEGLVIREAAGEDFIQIRPLIVKRAEELKLSDGGVSDTNKLVRDYCSKPAKFYCLVCELDTKIIGYVIYTYGYCVYSGRFTNVSEIYSIPEYQEVAQLQLLKRMVEITLNTGYQRLAWLSSKNSLEMHEFWIKHGATVYFEEEGYVHYQLDQLDIQRQVLSE